MRASMNGAMILGLEGGGTKTTVLLADATGQIRSRTQRGPLNLQLATDRQLLALFRSVAIGSRPTAIALCLAGCRTEADRQRLRELAQRVWGNVQLFVGNDLDSGLAAAFGATGAGMLVLSGTGSVVVGRNARGQIARAGGWGHLLGDHGSGYWIALTGLRAAIRAYDRHGRAPAAVLRRLGLNTTDQLVEWIHQAGKDDIAALADLFTRDVGLLTQAASFLAMDAEAVARKLQFTPARIVLAGGVLLHNPRLRRTLVARLRRFFPAAKISLLRRDTAEGALLLAGAKPVSTPPVLHPSLLPATEQRNPRTLDLDRRSVPELVDTMLAEEARVIPAIRKRRRAIARCINSIVDSFQRGGRLFYVGAGTSGRLGVLDASECPPTFSTDPAMVQAIIAGGVRALHTAVEGAEDDAVAGAEAIRQRGVTRRDVVVGIAASGRTPFVCGALDEAKRRGAKTFLLSCSPVSTPHSPLTILTGPEVLTGSTRLKAGTATKLVLNMLTTVSMIRLGKVVSNLMVDVKPTNEKLRARACRIVAALRGCSEAQARQRLERAGWNVKRAAR